MQTDSDFDARIIASLSQIYSMLADTEGDPAEFIGNVYEVWSEDTPKRLIIVGYSDELSLEGQPNGVLYPVVTRLFVVKQLSLESQEPLTESWLTSPHHVSKWSKVDRIDVAEPIVITPVFDVRRTTSAEDAGEASETHYVS